MLEVLIKFYNFSDEEFYANITVRGEDNSIHKYAEAMVSSLNSNESSSYMNWYWIVESQRWV